MSKLEVKFVYECSSAPENLPERLPDGRELDQYLMYGRGMIEVGIREYLVDVYDLAKERVYQTTSLNDVHEDVEKYLACRLPDKFTQLRSYPWDLVMWDGGCVVLLMHYRHEIVEYTHREYLLKVVKGDKGSEAEAWRRAFLRTKQKPL